MGHHWAFCGFQRRAASSRRSRNLLDASARRIASIPAIPAGRSFTRVLVRRAGGSDRLSTAGYARRQDEEDGSFVAIRPAYAPSGPCVFLDGDTLMGQAFDAQRLEISATAFVVEEGSAVPATGAGSYSLPGPVRWPTRAAFNTRPVKWFDRGGKTGPSRFGSQGGTIRFSGSPPTRRASGVVGEIRRTALPLISGSRISRGACSAPFTVAPGHQLADLGARTVARVMFRTTRGGGVTEFYVKSAGGRRQRRAGAVARRRRAASGALSAIMMHGTGLRDGRYLLFSATTSFRFRHAAGAACGDAKPGCVFCLRLAISGHANFRRMAKWWQYRSTTNQAALKSRSRHCPRRTALDRLHHGRDRNLAGRAEAVSCTTSRWTEVMGRWRLGPGPSFGAPTELFKVRAPAV